MSSLLFSHLVNTPRGTCTMNDIPIIQVPKIYFETLTMSDILLASAEY